MLLQDVAREGGSLIFLWVLLLACPRGGVGTTVLVLAFI